MTREGRGLGQTARGSLGVAGLLLVAAADARADAIDGNWCAGDGRVMTIEGPRIVTPAGSAARGDYSRHTFDYNLPTNEAGAGTQVRMVLLNEDTIRLTTGADPEIWHRCDVTS